MQRYRGAPFRRFEDKNREDRLEEFDPANQHYPDGV